LRQFRFLDRAELAKNVVGKSAPVSRKVEELPSKRQHLSERLLSLQKREFMESNADEGELA
jgi:hypothetical protein